MVNRAEYFSLRCVKTGSYVIPGNPFTEENFFMTAEPTVNIYKTKWQCRAEGFRDMMKNEAGIVVELVSTPDIAFSA